MNKKYVGVDYHKKFSYATMIDNETGEIKGEKLSNEEASFRNFIGDGKGTVAVLEAGRCWGWMYDMLDEMCDEVKLAHPYKIRLIAEARVKTDRVDSRVLAKLLSADMVPEAYGRNAQNRQDLAVLRQRVFWVGIRTRIKNRIHQLVDRQGWSASAVASQWSDLFGRAGKEWLGDFELPGPERELLDSLLEGLDFVERRIAESDRQVKRMYAGDEAAQRLRTVPGVGEFFSVLISAEIDDIGRFPSAAKLCAYAGLVPSTFQSGGNLRHGRLTKQGDKWLRWAVVEAVAPAVRANWQFRMLYEDKKKKSGAKRAKIVVARRILSIIYKMLKEDRDFEPYRPPKRILKGKRVAFCAP